LVNVFGVDAFGVVSAPSGGDQLHPVVSRWGLLLPSSWVVGKPQADFLAALDSTCGGGLARALRVAVPAMPAAEQRLVHLHDPLEWRLAGVAECVASEVARS
jgi:hypothetical protein